jgi:hypothetical protein
LPNCLDDPALFDRMGMSMTVEHYVQQLQRMGLPVLPHVVAEMQADQRNGVGNRFVRYDAQGVAQPQLARL